MSASRAHRVYEVQERVAAAQGVRTLSAMYPLTYRHAAQTRQGDGRHYTRAFNHFLWTTCFTDVQLCKAAIRARRPSWQQGIRRQACTANLVAQHSQARCRPTVNFGCTVAGDGSGAVWTVGCRGMFRCGGEEAHVPCGCTWRWGCNPGLACACSPRLFLLSPLAHQSQVRAPPCEDPPGRESYSCACRPRGIGRAGEACVRDPASWNAIY